MKTRKQFYDEPSLTKAEAVVVRCDPSPEQNQILVVLDSTIFYPTSGGQLHDAGTINSFPVVDVEESGDGTILHHVRTDAPIREGTRVTLEIDGSRRWDFTQQHSGQHILSAAFEKVLGIQTDSVHFGEIENTMDLSVYPLTPSMAKQSEAYANQIIRNHLPVSIQVIGQDRISDFHLRKLPDVSEDIRIVRFGDVDDSACCGTHVGNSVDVGLVLIQDIDGRNGIVGEKIRGGRTRIVFHCGDRAMLRVHRMESWLFESARLLGCEPQSVAEQIQRIQTDNKELSKNLVSLQTLTAVRDAAELWKSVSAVQGKKYIRYHATPDLSAETLRIFSAAIRENPLTGFAVSSFAGERLNIFLGCSDDLQIDVRPFSKDLFQSFGGKGGGNRTFVQGSLTVTVDQLKEVDGELERLALIIQESA